MKPRASILKTLFYLFFMLWGATTFGEAPSPMESQSSLNAYLINMGMQQYNVFAECGKELGIDPRTDTSNPQIQQRILECIRVKTGN